MPTIPQLEKLAEVLEFRPEELCQEDENDQIKQNTTKKMKKTYKKFVPLRLVEQAYP